MSFLAAALAVAAAATATTPAAPATTIDAAGIGEHLQALQRIADAHDGTRAAGTAGDTATAAYIAERLRAAGWTVSFRSVRFPFFAEHGRPQLGTLRRGTDFRVLAYSGSGTLRARVRPIDTQACNPATLAPVQRGEIALVARGTCTFRAKARNAERAGAGALLVVDAKARRPVPATLGAPGIRIPVLSVSAAAARRLARSTAPVALRVSTTSEERTSRSVIADSTNGIAAARRTVMAGAHLDSVPEGPGINDDGSGVAALLEIAERLRARPGVRLAFWAAEELGLYGSRAYVRSLAQAERRRIAAYVNLDMVGSPHPRPQVYDTDNAVERALRAAYDGRLGETTLGGSSDHAPFARARIPVGGLFTGASRSTDPCYHRACDTVRSADAAMAARMAQAARAALERLAR